MFEGRITIFPGETDDPDMIARVVAGWETLSARAHVGNTTRTA